jgi:hypothetical protein
LAKVFYLNGFGKWKNYFSGITMLFDPTTFSSCRLPT